MTTHFLDAQQAHIDAVELYLSDDSWLIQSMLAAYCKRTNVDPLDVVLVETELNDHTVAYQYAILVYDHNDEPYAWRPAPWWQRLLEYIRRKFAPLSRST